MSRASKRTSQFGTWRIAALSAALTVSWVSPGLGISASRSATNPQKVNWEIPLDDTGVAAWSVLSPRAPLEILPKDLCSVELLFVNDTVDRTFVVAIGDLEQKGKLEDLEDGEKVGNFSVKCEEKKCSLTAVVSLVEGARFPAEYLDLNRDCSKKVDNTYQNLCQALSPCLVSDKGETCAEPGDSELKAQCPGAVDPSTSQSRSESKTYSFDVGFFDDDGTPANPKAYFYVPGTPEQRLEELEAPPDAEESKVAWTLAAKVGYTQDPDPNRYTKEDETAMVIPEGKKAGDTRPFTRNLPFEGDERRRFDGSGTLKLKANMGSRAVASVDLRYKSGDLGEADQTGDVKAPQYIVDAYGLHHWQLRFGKTTFLAPSSGVAISLKGEGFQLIKRSVKAGYLAVRESETGVADRQDRDNQIFFLAWDAYPGKKQIKKRLDRIQSAERAALSTDSEGKASNGAPPPGDTRRAAQFSISSFKLYGVQGEEQRDVKTGAGPYEHWTLGGEASFRFLNRSVLRCSDAVTRGVEEECKRWTKKGSAALYLSERDGGINTQMDPDELTRIPDGSGTVWLINLGFSRLKIGENQDGQKEVEDLGSVGVVYGRGTGDDPKTAAEDEGYLGETASFAPDKLFLASLAANTSSQFTLDGQQETGGQIGTGLSNKEYLGLTYTNGRWSLLKTIADQLGFKKDVVSTKTVLRLNRYRFIERVFDSRDAGSEASIEFELEAPKGVSVSLGAAIFEPGDALETVLRDDPWTIFSSVTVKLEP